MGVPAAVVPVREWLAEPALYLLSIGIGVGALVGKVPGPNGELVSYKQFVAPGLLAAAAMNGAIFDTTFNFYFKLKYSHAFDAMIATPLSVRDIAIGETTWALVRGVITSAAFLVTMLLFGLVQSWWAVLALPAAVLISFGFATAGILGTTFIRSWLDFDKVNMFIIPMFLFSATFFPLSQYPDAAAGGRAPHPAVPGRRARTRADPRPAQLDAPAARGLSARHGDGLPQDRHSTPRPPPHPLNQTGVNRTHTYLLD